MLNDQALMRMQLTAYEAASDPRQWAALMHDLCDSFRATTASIFTPVAGAQQRFLAAAAGLDADGQALVAEWAPKDPWLTTRLERRLPMGRGTTARGSDYLPWPQLERTEFYNECGRHIGIKALITTVVEGDDGRFGVPRTHLALTRAPGLPDFGEQELRFLDDLGRPLRAALQSYFALERVQAVERTVEETMEAVPQPLYALRADGFVVHANGAGQALLADAGVMHTHNGQLLGVGNLTGATWTWALNFGLSGVHRPLPFWWLAHDGVRNGVVHIAPLAYTSPLSECWAAARLLMTVELEDSQQRKTARLAAAARRYGLTSTETSVLGHLRNGLSPEAVAGELAVQLSTVRSHVRHLMEKTGAKRIGELVALLV